MKLGSTDVSKLYLGSTEVQKVMLGSTEVWSGYDADAAAYFAAIVAAGSSISAANKAAVDAFVKGCKADGIWTAIKASCLLAGPDDLTGALVPLVGTAPTNFNFVSGDYNRTTGLVGDGSTKYLNSNRNNNADPQNNCHIYVRVTEPHTGANDRAYIGAATYSGTTRMIQKITNGLSFLCNGISSKSLTPTTGGLGVSRSNASNFSRIAFGDVDTVSVPSSEPISASLLVFRRIQGSEARLSFYSIGESLDLALLDARLTTYMSSLT